MDKSEVHQGHSRRYPFMPDYFFLRFKPIKPRHVMRKLTSLAKKKKTNIAIVFKDALNSLFVLNWNISFLLL